MSRAKVTVEVTGKETESFENFFLVAWNTSDPRGIRECVHSDTLTLNQLLELLAHAGLLVEKTIMELKNDR